MSDKLYNTLSAEIDQVFDTASDKTLAWELTLACHKYGVSYEDYQAETSYRLERSL